jgi:hypothetical protein
MKQLIPGWARIGENQFKAAILAAMRTDSEHCRRLRYAIMATAARRGIPQELRDRYIVWIGEVEMALAAMAEAQH